MKHCSPCFSNLRRSSCKAIAALLLFTAATPALGELMLYPTRIVFEGNQRAAKVELMNNGSTTATYRLSLVNRRMSETGSFSAIDSALPGEQFAESMVRYSPRQVTLAPGEGQTVRLMIRKPAQLESGEYRSHLLFSKQPDVEGQNSAEDLDTGDEGIGIQLTALVGASIPVIVRHGDTGANVRLTELSLVQDDSQPTMAFTIERDGNRSVYGDLTVSYTPKGGRAEVVARVSGVAVYTPNLLRRASLSLPEELAGLSSGTLRLSYRQQADDGGELLAEETLVLP